MSSNAETGKSNLVDSADLVMGRHHNTVGSPTNIPGVKSRPKPDLGRSPDASLAAGEGISAIDCASKGLVKLAQLLEATVSTC